MAERHLFSDSLFQTLFQHNLVSSDGYVKANDEDLMKFSTFLMRQAKEKTTEIYKMRKSMVDEVLLLIDDENLNSKGVKRLKLLLKELEMEIAEDGTLKEMEPSKGGSVYLGPSEPNQSYWERRFVAETKRLKILKRDLKILDNWLREISNPENKIICTPSEASPPSRTEEKKYRERTARRIYDLEQGRRNLIEAHHVENTRWVQHALSPKDSPGRVLRAAHGPDKETPRDSEDDSFVTAPDLSGGKEEDVSSRREDNKEGGEIKEV